MKCDLVAENELSISKNTSFIPTTISAVPDKISDYEYLNVQRGVNHATSDEKDSSIDNENRDNTEVPLPISSNKKITENSTNDIKKRASSLSNQMMAALGQPSTAPPSCGAAQTTVDHDPR